MIIYNTKLYVTEKLIILKKGNNEYKHYIYCFKNLILLLKYYNFSYPYIETNKKIIEINMEKDDENISYLNNETIIKEGPIINRNNYLINKELYDSENEPFVNIFDLENNNVDITVDKLGKYAKNYLDMKSGNEKLIYIKNKLYHNFQYETTYFENHDDKGIFNFLTGAPKSGKTFSLLSINLFEGNKNNYRLYLNDRYITQLEKEGRYIEILNMFFYEISKIFHTYDEYVDFSNGFLEKVIINKIEEIDFKVIISKFIEEIDIFVSNNRERYKKMILIFDDYELDEVGSEKFRKNYDFIYNLYNKRCKNSKIHFLFISPINNNYIKKCVLFDMKVSKILESSYPSLLTLKDDKKDYFYFPFTYYSTCFYDSITDFDNYKKLVEKKNKEEINISKFYLNKINYSLFHLNNIKHIYNEGFYKNTKIGKICEDIKNNEPIVEYIKECEEESYKIVSSFFHSDNDLYIFNFDKVKKCHQMIDQSNKNNIDLDNLQDILNYIPLQFLQIFNIDKTEEKDIQKYKILYLYSFHHDSIEKYLLNFQNNNFEENKEIKPGSKGDLLETKVIEAIRFGYFNDLKPDKIIEVNSIYKISEFYDKNKNDYKDIIEQLEEIFSDENINLIMINQNDTNGKRYDLAFLQKYKKGKWQFILVQITRNKSTNEMLQYKDVDADCFNFGNFFTIFDGIEVKRYHFLFIFQAGLYSPAKDFCKENNIKFIEFCILDNKSTFYDSKNRIIKNLVFDEKSSSMVYLIGSNQKKEDNGDNISNPNDIYFLRKKRENKLEISEAKYILGSIIYKKILKLLNIDAFELSKKYYGLEENRIFYVYKSNGKDNRKQYYLMYLKEGQKQIIEIIYGKDSKKNKNNNIISENQLYNHNMEFKCFQIID